MSEDRRPVIVLTAEETRDLLETCKTRDERAAWYLRVKGLDAETVMASRVVVRDVRMGRENIQGSYAPKP